MGSLLACVACLSMPLSRWREFQPFRSSSPRPTPASRLLIAGSPRRCIAMVKRKAAPCGDIIDLTEDDDTSWKPPPRPARPYSSHASTSRPPPQPEPILAPPPAKKPRKQKEPKAASSQEKRPARFRAKCPQNILDRLDRVVSQRYASSRVAGSEKTYDYDRRFFMIDRHRDGGELKEEFSVLGSTGNVSGPMALVSLTVHAPRMFRFILSSLTRHRAVTVCDSSPDQSTALIIHSQALMRRKETTANTS